MSRPRSALLLLLGLASPGAAQSLSTAAWALPSGDFTIYGHTSYSPRFTLLPRIVYDTARGVDSTRVVDSVRVTATHPAGFAAGMSAWPAERYCGGPTSAATQPLNPAAVLGRVQLAARCGVRLVIVPPRRFLTTTGQTTGTFSVDSAKRVTDRFAAELPPDTLRKYRETILGFNLADDYGCTRCWGGERITQAQIAEWAAYARATLPGLPLGVRKTPDWVAAYPALAPLLDYTWAQYHTRKGDQQAFYDKAATIAKRLGLWVVMGINVEDCYGVGTSACEAEDLIRLGTLAVSHPASCAFLNWKYAEKTWRRAEIREAWDELLALARTRPAEECRRAEADA
ncbi:MAG: hypothetical protein H0T68_12635 [Gemmatimonadales bacterium]|nr:hypothetical protein [Gemmatimonadales bacterium]